jgi:hypothetical protein
MHETSGQLRPVVMAYLVGAPLNPREIAIMRAYLRQWINSEVWAPTEDICWLRAEVGAIETPQELYAWLDRAELAFVDPL